jgi:hypothetical protein
VKILASSSNNLATTPDKCGTVIGSISLDPGKDRTFPNLVDCCINKAVKVSASELKSASEAFAAKHAKVRRENSRHGKNRAEECHV